MKRLLFLLSILVIALPAHARADTLLERIATQILADRFGIDTSDILGLRREYREDVWDLGPVYSMSRYGNSSASEVQRLRASGMGWGNIAKKIGMHPGTFNKLRQQGYFERDRFWDDVIRRRYSVRQSDIDVVRRRGARLEDVLGTIIVAKASKRSPSEVYGRYREVKSWDRTADRYKVDLNRWNTYGKKVGWDGGSVPPGKPSPNVAPGVVKGKGKPNPPGKGQAKVKTGPPDKGPDKTKGHGQSHGKGKGKGKGGG